MADLFDIVTARKLSGGGGGGGTTVEALSVTQNGTYTAPSGKAYSPVSVNVSGGSSDFSTATVTVANSAGSQFMLSHLLPFGDGSFPAVDVNDGNIQAILYKGSAMGLILGGTVTIEGSATYSAPILTVTGDCTITIS